VHRGARAGQSQLSPSLRATIRCTSSESSSEQQASLTGLAFFVSVAVSRSLAVYYLYVPMRESRFDVEALVREHRSEIARKFWRRVDRRHNGCWLWKGGKTSGYGVFTIDLGDRKYSFRAHRIAYALGKGNLPKSLCVLHACDNPSCMNPRHLWLGTLQDNLNDMVRKGRSLVGVKNPASKLTPSAVRKIRRLYNAGGISMPALAARFGVVYNTVFLVIHRLKWKGVR
jgi:hypothetical protein